ncbi:hypothetical protein [Rahnella variigena]|uniref:hypothetical protein n=1 Tax=Rahnella variigena TaxID=574964 RepID=UPI0028DB8EF6|nr:hypothetical protein [Rahnella variigena]
MKLKIKTSASKRIEGDSRRWRRRQRQWAKRRGVEGFESAVKYCLSRARNHKR